MEQEDKPCNILQGNYWRCNLSNRDFEAAYQQTDLHPRSMDMAFHPVDKWIMHFLGALGQYFIKRHWKMYLSTSYIMVPIIYKVRQNEDNLDPMTAMPISANQFWCVKCMQYFSSKYNLQRHQETTANTCRFNVNTVTPCKIIDSFTRKLWYRMPNQQHKLTHMWKIRKYWDGQ